MMEQERRAIESCGCHVDTPTGLTVAVCDQHDDLNGLRATLAMELRTLDDLATVIDVCERVLQRTDAGPSEDPLGRSTVNPCHSLDSA